MAPGPPDGEKRHRAPGFEDARSSRPESLHPEPMRRRRRGDDIDGVVRDARADFRLALEEAYGACLGVPAEGGGGRDHFGAGVEARSVGEVGGEGACGVAWSAA